MPIIVNVAAKGLAIADALLSYFATTVGTSNLVSGQCANLTVVNVEVTPCGMSVAQLTAGLAEITLRVSQYLLAGTLAV